MGITGLLPFLEPATKNCNVSEFRGATVAIDTYCWLHKGATACADVLARGEETNVYVNYCMKYVNLLMKYDIKPIMVFDGNHLPAKAITEKRRRETRKNAKVRAAELLRLGKKDEAWNYFRQSIDITPKMALNLIQECRRNGVDCIVAPYESDAQLAYLNLKGIADVVITEDSDLVLFGCKAVFYKMDINGNGRLVEKEKLPLCMKMTPDKYTFDKFRYMCILSGCDYLDSLPGVGLKKALKFVSLTAETDPVKFLDKVPRYLNLKNQIVTSEYKDNFLVADATFRHQLVFDPIARKLVHLTDPAMSGTRPEYCRNAGEFFNENTAFQVAVGNLNPSTYEKYDDWSPTKNGSNSLHSVWSQYYVKKISRKEQRESERIEKLADQMKKNLEETKEITEQNLVDDTHALQFESELSIYYAKKTSNQLIHSKEGNDKCDIIEVEEKGEDNALSKSENDNTSDQDDSKEVSPVLKGPRNPFLKKRLSKFNLTMIEKDKIVRSKYFHSKSEDLSHENSELKEPITQELVHDEALTINDDNCKKRKIIDEDLEHNCDQQLETQDEIVVLNNEPVSEPKKALSQDSAKLPKKPKLTRCRSVGLPPKKQITIQSLFANIKAKKS